MFTREGGEDMFRYDVQEVEGGCIVNIYETGRQVFDVLKITAVEFSLDGAFDRIKEFKAKIQQLALDEAEAKEYLENFRNGKGVESNV